MQKKIWFLLTFSFVLTAHGAIPYRQALSEMAGEMAAVLARKGKPAVAVYPFYESGNRITEFSRVVSEDFSIVLGKHRGFRIIDRAYLEQMLEEHRLNAEGLIDPRTAKRFGMIIAADYYITGQIHILRYSFRLSVMAINTQTGERIFADSRIIALDADLATLAGIKDWKRRDEERSNEEAAGQNDCMERQTGHVCFINRTGTTYRITVFGTKDHSVYGEIRVAPGRRACMYDLPGGKTYRYQGMKSQVFIGDILPKGQFRIVTCRTLMLDL